MDVEMQSATKIELKGAIYAEDSSDGENRSVNIESSEA